MGESATSTTFAITSIGNAILSTNTNGSVVATTSIGTNLLTGILSIGNGGTATSTQVTNGINYFDGTTITSSPALSFTGTNIIVGTNLNLNDGNGMYYSNPSAGSFNFGSMAGGGAYPLTLSSGNGSNFYTGTYFDISASGIGDVFGLTYYNGFFWASGSNNKVYKYNTDGTYTGTNFDTSGSGGTYGIAYYNGFFWITDYSANKVYKYDTSGTYTSVSFDTSASGDTSPVGITYYNGYFWIVSWTNKKVYQYNTDGTYAGTKFDTSPSGINTASGIAYYNGFFWITDYGSGKIYKVTTAGVYTGVNIDISSSGNTDPTGIVYYNGFLWSTGFTQKTIYKYSPDTYSGGYIALSTDGGERMRIDTAGNVGIGTSTPYSRLEVWGPDKAASTSAFLVTDSASDTEFAVLDNGNATLAGNLIQNSDQRLKTNIQTLDGSSSLTEIRALNPVTFYWIDPAKSAVPQYGFIAQQIQSVFPNLVSTTSPTTLTPDGTLSLNYIDLISPIVAAIQELDKKITSLASTVAGFAQSITSAVGNFGQVNTNELCVGKTCVTEAQLQTLLAAANQSASAPASPSPSTSAATNTPPVIAVNGDNPAVVQVGASYSDLGATITGPKADLNLAIETYVNGTLESAIALETSSAATDTVAYVVTDTQGLTSTSTRTVLIESATVAATSSPAQ